MKVSMIFRHALRLIGVVVFIYILLGIDFQMMLDVALSINPLITLSLLGLVIPIMIMKGARWVFIIQGLDLRLSTLRATEALCIAQMANLALPGSVGDLVRVPFLTSRGNPTDKSIVSLFIDAIIGSLVPYTAGVLAILYILDFDITIIGILIAIAWVGGGYLIYRFLKATIWNWFIKARIKRLTTQGITGNPLFAIPTLLKSLGIKKITYSILFATSSWLLYTIQSYILALAFGISTSWTFLAISLGLATMLTAIPISIQGLGIREGVLMFMLGILGNDPTIIVSFSITLMLFNLSPSIVGLLSWANDPFVAISDEAILDVNDLSIHGTAETFDKEDTDDLYVHYLLPERNNLP